MIELFFTILPRISSFAKKECAESFVKYGEADGSAG